MSRHTHDDPEHARLLDAVNDALQLHDPDARRLHAMKARLDAPVLGGTTLREVRHTRGRSVAAAVLGAAALLALTILLPAVDQNTTVSAAEILSRSRAALAAKGSGVEVLTYDLSVEGVLNELLPFEQTGRLTVEETIDHDHEGRYRLLKIAPDGLVVGAIADDPVRGQRVRYVRANGRGYLLRFSDENIGFLSFLRIKRFALQGFITMMQAEATEAVREVQRDGEFCYEVVLEEQSDRPAALVSLSRGRALITAADSRLVEFSAAGLLADRPFAIDFVQKRRELRPASSAAESDFDVAPQPGDVILQGSGSSNPVWDVVERALAAIPPQRQR